LEYAEDTAGGIMTTNLVAAPTDATVRDATQKLRTDFLGEDIHYIYVVNQNRELTGLVSLRQLLLNEADTRLGAICSPDPITVHVDDDQEEVIHVISKYDIAAVPVVDDKGRLLGRITHADIMDVYEDEADEDMYRMAGLDAAEFEKASVVRAAGIRLSWLIPCLASMAIAAGVMALAQQWFDQLPVYAALIIFVPMIGAIGGNSGIQISTIIVRGLATGDLASKRFRSAFNRQGRIAVIMAPVCGLVAWTICRLGLPAMQRMTHAGGEELAGSASPIIAVDINRVAFSVGLGMTCSILVAASLGMLLPFLFRRIRVDPAIASGPIVTTANDVISVTIFLGLAALIMAW
jgi:magnesium transporter